LIVNFPLISRTFDLSEGTVSGNIISTKNCLQNTQIWLYFHRKRAIRFEIYNCSMIYMKHEKFSTIYQFILANSLKRTAIRYCYLCTNTYIH